MSKHPDWEDDSFDEFIRRSVEEPQIPFDPKAWQAMEQKLDAAARGQGSAGKGGNMGGRIAGFVAVILLLSGLGWLAFSGLGTSGNGKEGNEQAVQLGRQAAAEEKASAENPAIKLPPAENAGIIQVPEEKNSQSSSTAAMDREQVDKREAERKSNTSQPPLKGVASGSKSSSQNELAGQKTVLPVPKSRKETIVAGAMEAGQEQPGIPEVEESVEQGKGTSKSGSEAVKESEALLISAELAKEEQQAATNKLIEKRSWLPLLFVEPLIASDIPLVSNWQEEKEEVVVLPSKARKAPLSVSLTLAPDFSGTGQQGSMKTGAGMGLHLEYKILQRLSVVGGIFYSKKNYLTDNSFSPYGKFWDYRPEPDHIDVSCGVFDMPLNLRYYVLNGNKHSFFLSGGFSSYFMWSEDYTLVYNSGQWKDYTYEVRNENRHLFAVYNLSVGYERNFAGRWALQLEPFMKIPARGVGIGSIKLNSMGAFVHLKYKIGRLGQ